MSGIIVEPQRSDIEIVEEVTDALKEIMGKLHCALISKEGRLFIAVPKSDQGSWRAIGEIVECSFMFVKYRPIDWSGSGPSAPFPTRPQ